MVIVRLFSRGYATLELVSKSKWAFLVADTRLYTLPCRSVGPSVHHIFEFRAVFALLLLPNRPRLDCRVSGLFQSSGISTSDHRYLLPSWNRFPSLFSPLVATTLDSFLLDHSSTDASYKGPLWLYLCLFVQMVLGSLIVGRSEHHIKGQTRRFFLGSWFLRRSLHSKPFHSLQRPNAAY